MLLFQGFTQTWIPSIPFGNQMKVITLPTHFKFYNDKCAETVNWLCCSWINGCSFCSVLISLFLDLWAFWYPFRHSAVQLLVFKTVWYSALGLTWFDSCRQLSNVVLGSIPGGSVVNNPPAKAGDAGLSSGSGRSPGKGNGNPLKYASLENPMDREAW